MMPTDSETREGQSCRSAVSLTLLKILHCVKYYANDDRVTTNKYQVVKVGTGCFNCSVISTANVRNKAWG